MKIVDVRQTESRPQVSTAAVAVLLVDDQQAVRDGLARLIGSAPLLLRAVASAATGVEALHTAAWLHPDVVVLDADLAGEDGLALIPQLAPAVVLVLTCHADPATCERAARLGAWAFIEKHEPAAVLLDAVLQLVAPQMRGEKAPALRSAESPGAVAASSGVHDASRP